MRSPAGVTVLLIRSLGGVALLLTGKGDMEKLTIRICTTCIN